MATRTWELYNTPDGTGVFEDKTVGKYVTPTYDRDRINILSMATTTGTIDTVNNYNMDLLEGWLPGLSFDYGETGSVFGLYQHGDEVVFPKGTNQIIGVIIRRHWSTNPWYTHHVCFIDCRAGCRIRNSEKNDSDWDVNIFVFSYTNIDDCLVLGCDVSDSVCNVFNYPECYNFTINWNGTGSLSGVLLDGIPISLPTTQKVKSGPHTISVPSTVSLSGYVYFFDAWENGEMTTTRTVNVDKDMSIVANYVMPECKEGTTTDSEQCWDNSIVYHKVCENGRLVDTGEKCPTQICAEGTYRCDGCDRYVCQDNAYKISEEDSSKCCECFIEGETKCASELGRLGYDLYRCVGGKWVKYQSNATECGYTGPVDVCSYSHPELCTTQVGCVNAGLYWYNSKCNTTPESVCSYATPEKCLTKTDCEGADLYWYNNKCNKTPLKPVEWYDWFTQETLVPGIQNWILVAAGVTVPIVIGGVAYWALKK